MREKIDDGTAMFFLQQGLSSIDYKRSLNLLMGLRFLLHTRFW
jgi:hypothetical protein